MGKIWQKHFPNYLKAKQEIDMSGTNVHLIELENDIRKEKQKENPDLDKIAKMEKRLARGVDNYNFCNGLEKHLMSRPKWWKPYDAFDWVMTIVFILCMTVVITGLYASCLAM